MNVSDADKIKELEKQVQELRAELATVTSEGPLLRALLDDIAERKKIEEELNEAQHWLHLAQEAGRVAAYSYDFESQRLSWSPSAYALYGVTAGTVPSLEAWLDAVHPDDRPQVSAATQDSIAHGKDVDQQYRIVRPDGSVRWLHDRGRVLLGKKGAPRRIVGLNIDITDHRETEAALRSGEARFRALAEMANAIVWTVDAKGRFVAECDSWSSFTGQSYAEYKDYGWLDAVHPDDRDGTWEVWRAASKNGSDYAHEYRLRRHDGEFRHMLARAASVRGTDGKVSEYTGANVDISQQIRSAGIIVDREERLRAALAGCGAGTFRWNINDNSLDWDVELDRLFGLPPGETVRSLDAFVACVHPDDRPAIIAACQACAESGVDFEEDFRVVWPDGTVRWLYDRGRTHCDAQGRPSYMTGSCIDITERKEAVRKLQESEERLRIAQEAGDGFIAVDSGWRVLIFNKAAEKHFGVVREQVVGRRFFQVFDYAVGSEFQSGLNEAMEQRHSIIREAESLARPGSGIEFKAFPTPDGGLAITFSDVTDRRAADRLRELLVGELQHRVKNMLSVVQATAHQTFKTAEVPQPVRSIFNDRLAALSRAHDLVVEQHWEAASLEDTTARALAPFVDNVGERIRWAGPLVMLPARSAIAFALALHELATNAVKYGALSNDVGQVSISWFVSASGDLRFEWQESDGPVVTPPSRSGFGSRLIERSLAAELKGSVQMDYASRGLRCIVAGPKP